MTKLGSLKHLNNFPALSPTVSHSPSSEDDRGGGGSRVKRGVLPKHATQVMKSWLFQHIVVSNTYSLALHDQTLFSSLYFFY